MQPIDAMEWPGWKAATQNFATVGELANWKETNGRNGSFQMRRLEPARRGQEGEKRGRRLGENWGDASDGQSDWDGIYKGEPPGQGLAPGPSGTSRVIAYSNCTFFLLCFFLFFFFLLFYQYHTIVAKGLKC